jgi:putative endonuclease
MLNTYYVYILASSFQKLYIGVANNLSHRISQHKTEKNPRAHTARYKIDKLVYYERFEYIQNAIAREKQIKGWLRIKKLQLIAATNPTWRAGPRLGTTHRTVQRSQPPPTRNLLTLPLKLALCLTTKACHSDLERNRMGKSHRICFRRCSCLFSIKPPLNPLSF